MEIDEHLLEELKKIGNREVEVFLASIRRARLNLVMASIELDRNGGHVRELLDLHIKLGEGIDKLDNIKRTLTTIKRRNDENNIKGRIEKLRRARLLREGSKRLCRFS